jgi:hypothetical protein
VIIVLFLLYLINIEVLKIFVKINFLAKLFLESSLIAILVFDFIHNFALTLVFLLKVVGKLRRGLRFVKYFMLM